jgi:glycerol-3-phosphate dehydrogenase (NAD+)
VGNNVVNSENFQNQVPMYVYEEMVDGKKLTEIINTQHENVKYLKGFKLPENVVAIADVCEAAKDADILVFVVPHQFVKGICKQLQGKLKQGALAVSLIKGLDISEKGLDLISNVIRQMLKIECAVLMGANIAPEVARENYCEATIGCMNRDMGRLLKEVFEAPYFRIVVVSDEKTVELCGALKNVVAVGAGFVDGLKYGDNTKAAVIRLGLMEMVKFCEEFFNNSQIETFLESCGVADLVTTCYSGRNRRVADAFVTSGKTIEELEAEMLNGQKLQGPPTAAEVYIMLEQKGLTEKFPMFTAVHKICIGELPPQAFIDCLKNHPEHMESKY